MSSPDELWWELHAGEYVLGTLDAKARELFERILRHDRELQRSVRDWERRLAPLDAATPAREPPTRVWRLIEQRLRAGPEPNGGTARLGGADNGDDLAHVELMKTPHDVTDDRADDPTYARSRDEPDVDPFDDTYDERGDGREGDAGDGWRDEAGERRRAMPFATSPGERAPSSVPRAPSDKPPAPPPLPPPLPRRPLQRANPLVALVASFATAISLILGTMLFEQHQRLKTLQGSILQADGISVILGENGAPLWLVQADFAGERVRVTALAPPPAESGSDYQLWQVLPEGGVSPVALLPESGGTSVIAPVPGLARRFDAFAVSLEPDGGSPEAEPTGAVLYQADVTYPEEEQSP